ncbi:MAG: F0F1 ATP synthase subunit B, partial [Oscillospiraceae bacterium]|nr:F0F1 ATP synthase subunit B [Oscillospiraceae bacterium]
MPRKIFSSVLISVIAFIVLAVLFIMFLSLADDGAPAGSILAFDKSLLIRLGIQWINIAILTAVLIFILYQPVRKFMSDRADRIRNDIVSARQSNEDAQKLKAEYEAKLANIGRERDDILNKAHRAAVAEHDKILSVAQEEAKHLISNAHDEIKLERDSTNDEIRRQIIEISTLMAARFIET